MLVICTNIIPAKTVIMLLEVSEREHSMQIPSVCTPSICITYLISWACMLTQKLGVVVAVYQAIAAECHNRAQTLRALNPWFMNSSESAHKTVRYSEEHAYTSCPRLLQKRALQEQRYRLVSP